MYTYFKATDKYYNISNKPRTTNVCGVGERNVLYTNQQVRSEGLRVPSESPTESASDECLRRCPRTVPSCMDADHVFTNGMSH